MAPLYDYQCQATTCGQVFEAWRPYDRRDAIPACPECQADAHRMVTFRQSKPTFTERLYPFYHQGIGKVVHSETDLHRQCEELGFVSKHEGAYMTPKHERKLLSKRLTQRPREVVEKIRWSGKGAMLPMFETFDSETGEPGQTEAAMESPEE